MRPLRLAIVGGGWSGMAAAVAASQAGHAVTVFEATRQWGGRARALQLDLPDGSPCMLDNGQHILIGAYADSLALMRQVGVDTEQALLRLPLCLQYPDGLGLRLPNWPVPLDLLAGIAAARGWTVADKLSLLRTTSRWQRSGFACDTQTSVAHLCQGLSAAVMDMLIEPLCVSALNTPPERSSGQVFLRVLKDALLGGRGSSHLLLPRTDLSSLFPAAAARWLQHRGASLRLGQRVTHIQHAQCWQLDGEDFDAVLWATAPSAASHALAQAGGTHAAQLHAWARHAAQLAFEGIATVYCQAGTVRLPRPLLALRSGTQGPAQFVFDRGQLGGPVGLLAFVVSASQEERAVLQDQVCRQAEQQLAGLLQGQRLQPLQTVVEKRATFACTPGLLRPAQRIAPGLLACGDYVQGPYPATLEGAVQSGLAAVRDLHA